MPPSSSTTTVLSALHGLPDNRTVSEAAHGESLIAEQGQETPSPTESISRINAELQSELSRFASYFTGLSLRTKMVIGGIVALIGINMGALMGAVSIGFVLAESIYLLTGYLLISHHHGEAERFAFLTQATADAEQLVLSVEQDDEAILSETRTMRADLHTITDDVLVCQERFSEQTAKLTGQVAVITETTVKFDDVRIDIEASNLRLQHLKQRMDDRWGQVTTALAGDIDRLAAAGPAISLACRGIENSSAVIRVTETSLSQTAEQLTTVLTKLAAKATEETANLDVALQHVRGMAAMITDTGTQLSGLEEPLKRLEQQSALADEAVQRTAQQRLQRAERNRELDAQLAALANRRATAHARHLSFFPADASDTHGTQEGASLAPGK